MLRIERKLKYFLLNFLSKFLNPKEISFDRINLKKIKNILVIGQDRFGDCILSTPALKALRLLVPDSNIIYLAHGKYGDIITVGNPNINEIIIFDKKEIKNGLNLIKFILNLRSKKIDLAIVLPTHPVKLTNAVLSYISGAKFRIGYRSTYIKIDEIDEGGMNKLFFNCPVDRPNNEAHEVEWNLKLIESIGFNSNNFDKNPQIYLTTAEKEEAGILINSLRKTRTAKLIGMHPLVPDGNHWKLEDYIEFIDKVYNEKIAEIILFWHLRDEFKNIEFIMRKLKNKPIISPETKSIRNLASFISKLNLFIGKDTAGSHIAAAFSIPTIVLFTQRVNVNQWKPWGNSVLFTANLKFDVNNVYLAIKHFL